MGGAKSGIDADGLADADLPNLDPRAGRMMMVTRLNEWFEDSQIEATEGTAPATHRDDSPSGTGFTGGSRYEDCGSLYQDVLRKAAEGSGKN